MFNTIRLLQIFIVCTPIFSGFSQSGSSTRYNPNAQDLHFIAKEFYLNRDFENALIFLNKSIELDDQIFENYFTRGNTYKELGKYDLAEKDYQKAMDIRPDMSYQAFNNIGILYNRRLKYKEAIYYFEKSILSNSYCYECYYNYAAALEKLGNKSKSINSYLKAIEINPNSPNAFYNLANIYFETEKYLMAIEYYSRALKLNPKNYLEITYNRGMAYVKVKDFSNAKIDFQKYVDVVKTNQDAYYNLALTCYQTKDIDGSCFNAKLAQRLGKNEAEIFIDATCR